MAKQAEATKFVKGVPQKPSAKNKALNPKTVEEAVEQVKPFIYSLARKWTRNHNHLFNDFVSEGYVGALEAWKRFSGTDYEKKGYRFSSYCWFWIRACMKDYADRQWKYMNNTTPDRLSVGEGDDSVSLIELNAEGYEVNTDILDIQKLYNKLSEGDKKLVELRALGYSYEECAENLGFKTLHQARSAHLEILERFANVE